MEEEEGKWLWQVFKLVWMVIGLGNHGEVEPMSGRDIGPGRRSRVANRLCRHYARGASVSSVMLGRLRIAMSGTHSAHVIARDCTHSSIQILVHAVHAQLNIYVHMQPLRAQRNPH